MKLPNGLFPAPVRSNAKPPECYEWNRAQTITRHVRLSKNSILAPDINTFIYLEYKAYVAISAKLGHSEKNLRF